MQPDKLVYMANQIGKFFAHQGEETGAASVADHITKYWDPRMRSTMAAHVAEGGAGLDPMVLRGLKSVPQKVVK